MYVYVCMYVCKERRVGKGNELVKQGWSNNRRRGRDEGEKKKEIAAHPSRGCAYACAVTLCAHIDTENSTYICHIPTQNQPTNACTAV